MSVTISEAVRELLAGRAKLALPGGGMEDVVPDPEPAGGDWGPPYLDPPFPALPLSGTPVPPENIRFVNPFPMRPIVIDDSDLAPE